MVSLGVIAARLSCAARLLNRGRVPVVDGAVSTAASGARTSRGAAGRARGRHARRAAAGIAVLCAAGTIGVPGAAGAQPCGEIDPLPLPAEVLDRLIADLRGADAAAGDVSAAVGERLAAYHRMVQVAQEVDDAYGTCDVPAAGDEERFRAAAGRELARWSDWRAEAWAACAALVAETHASGEEARTCVREGARPLRPLAPQPPAGWLEAGADDGARIFEELRDGLDARDAAARTDLVAICLAAGDWQGALDLGRPLSWTYEGGLLRAAALAGFGEVEDAASAYRRLVHRDPGRPEAHFNLALLAAARWYWPRRGPAGLRRPFLHALAYLCLTDAADDPESADDATGFARNLEEALSGRSAWIWRSEEGQPPLPLPVSELGPEAQGFPAGTPFAHTCPEVLREAAPGLGRTRGVTDVVDDASIRR
jgi:hypothetical protein